MCNVIMSNAEFRCVNWPINIESTIKNSFTPSIKAWLFSAPIFTHLVLDRQIFVHIFYSELLQTRMTNIQKRRKDVIFK